MNLEPIAAEKDLEPAPFAIFMRRVFLRATFAAIEWLSHCVVIAVILCGMRGLELLTHLLWGRQKVTFLGFVSIHELFSTADFLLLVFILFLGIACVIKAYRGVR